MNNNFEKIKTYISNIKKYQIKKEESILINYKLLNEDINDINKDLISHLIKDKLCKELFFDKVEDVYIFNQNKFIEVIFNTNEYMENSYTKYENKVGLFLKDKDTVQLNFPYKDCVLIGGMDKEDDKVNLEVFYNETLEKDKINKLFEPKVFHNINKFSYSKDLAENDKLDNPNNIQVDTDISKINFNQDKIKDNLLIKGNNLLGLHSLARRLNGSIDVIYIDPPYYFNGKKSADSFAYNSNFKLSTWLTFMKNRLEIAKELLSDKGLIFISMNEDGNNYLNLICKEIFGSQNVGINIWNKLREGDSAGKSGKMKKTDRYRQDHEYINICYKNKLSTTFNKPLRIKDLKTEYGNKDNDPRGNWYDTELSKSEIKSNPNGVRYYKVTAPEGNVFWRQWHIEKEKLNELIEDNRIWWGQSNNNAPRLKKFVNEKTPTTPTSIISNYTQNDANEELKLFEMQIPFDNPKPMNLIKYLIEISSNKASVILDFFAGSGTTAHSVLDLNKEDNGNRNFILLEQMDYIENLTAERIKRAMIKEGYEDSFIYMEMKESEIKQLKNNIKSSTSKDELLSLINDNFDNGFFINIDNKEQLLLKIEEVYSKSTKKSNPLNDSIKLVIEKYMDNNIDYISYEDIEGVNIKENELKLNKSFYEGK